MVLVVMFGAKCVKEIESGVMVRSSQSRAETETESINLLNNNNNMTPSITQSLLQNYHNLHLKCNEFVSEAAGMMTTTHQNQDQDNNIISSNNGTLLSHQMHASPNTLAKMQMRPLVPFLIHSQGDKRHIKQEMALLQKWYHDAEVSHDDHDEDEMQLEEQQETSDGTSGKRSRPQQKDSITTEPALKKRKIQGNEDIIMSTTTTTAAEEKENTDTTADAPEQPQDTPQKRLQNLIIKLPTLSKKVELRDIKSSLSKLSLLPQVQHMQILSETVSLVGKKSSSKKKKRNRKHGKKTEMVRHGILIMKTPESRESLLQEQQGHLFIRTSKCKMREGSEEDAEWALLNVADLEIC